MTDDDCQRQAGSDSAAVQHGGADGSANTPEVGGLSNDPPTVTKEEICNFLSHNSQVFFKSQQIDDPDLTSQEKQSIALEIYNENKHKFLLRFGKYLQRDHLRHFELITSADQDETVFLIHELQRSLQTHDRDVKNRRYAAMQSMIKADNYFSEREIMKREPHLYEQMIGQYLTDAEKRVRDRVGEDCIPFSSILLDNYDNDEMEKLRKRQKREEGSEDDDDDTTMSEKSGGYNQDNKSIESDQLFPELPASQRKQWGNFEDEENDLPMSMPGPSKKPNRKREEKFITAAEREMLRQEFMGIMYENFLEGKDKDFDYSAVDNNSDLDDLEQIGQDKEDKYFDDDDDEHYVMETSHSPEFKGEKIERDDSEDELDIYMKHLNRHPTVVKQLDG